MENFEQERKNIDTEEIKRFYDVIETKRDNVVIPSGKLNLEAYQRLTNFIDKLEKKYGREELQKCAAFHAASGSTIAKDEFVNITRLDFPGEDSIENFLDSQK